MSKRISIVVTTIHGPEFLEGYVEDIRDSGLQATTDIIVIPDRKTPPSVFEWCSDFVGGALTILCPDISRQSEFLEKFPSLADRIPFDTDHRRNVGFLMALDRGADIVISIDDDNYVEGGGFVDGHSVVGEYSDAPIVESESGWFNTCNMLVHEPIVEIYPRGYPYFARSPATVKEGHAPGKVSVNAGLWTLDPDVDAVTRLALGPTVESLRSESILLGKDTWAPINTQNTSVERGAMGAFWYVRMGFRLGGLLIDRYGDILSGYFCAKCVKSLGESIRIGTPTTIHRRSEHNLFKDAYHELAGMMIIEDLLPWLVEQPLTGSSYTEVYRDLSHALDEQASRFAGFVWDEGAREFLVSTAEDMRAWAEAVETVG